MYIVHGDQEPHNFNSSTTAAPSSSSTVANTASRTQAAATTSSNASSGAPTSSPNPSPSNGSGLSSGAKAGIGVGVALGVLLALGMVAWFLLRRRNRASAPAYTDYRSAPAPVEKDASWKRPAGPHEVHSDQHTARQEMPGVQPAMHREGLAELGHDERG